MPTDMNSAGCEQKHDVGFRAQVTIQGFMFCNSYLCQ